MRAIIRPKAGKNFSSLRVENLPAPAVQTGELKVRMVSARINPVDMDLMKGFPALTYKKPQIAGIDGAGIVLETGPGVTQFQAGDRVFFYRLFTDIGTWAEEITVRVQDCARIPEGVGVLEAGGIVLPLLTAYECLMELKAQPGETLLIHGAGGGVGFQAVLLAKALGLRVIGTAGAGDRALLEAAGADQILDYAATDFSQVLGTGTATYVLDLVGGTVLQKSLALRPRILVSVKYIDPARMTRTGIRLPGLLAWILRLSMRKWDRLARQHQVRLIGQVTGADGKQLQAAADLLMGHYIPRPFTYLTLTEIAGRGLTPADLGKVIRFSTEA